MQLDRGHIQYVRDIQRVRSSIDLTTDAERAAFEAIVVDAILDPENRQPAFWKMDGYETSGVIEYTLNESPVRTTYLRYVTRVLGLAGRVASYTIEDVCRKIEAIVLFKEADFKVIDGYDIVEAYRSNIDGGNGCMRGKAADYTEWYAENPSSVKMLTYKDKARALLWTCDDGTRVLDRIYLNDGAHVAHMKMWARLHGCLYRSCQGAEFNGWIDPSGKMDAVATSHLVVTMAEPSNQLLPWVDSFQYADMDSGDLVCRAYSGTHVMQMQVTDGSGLIDTEECHNCEHSVAELNDGFCHHCAEDMNVCEQCEHLCEGTYTVRSDSGEEEWCYSCTHTSGDTVVCHGCNIRATVHDTPTEWCEVEDRRGNTVRYCDSCSEDHKCKHCGETAVLEDLVLYYRGSSKVEQKCCHPCSESAVEAVESALSELAHS